MAITEVSFEWVLRVKVARIYKIWASYRAGQVLAISDFKQSPSDGFDELGAEVWCVQLECLNDA